MHDGTNGVRYQKMPVGPGGDGGPVVVRSMFPPGTEVPAHSHVCDYVEIILEGSEEVTRRWRRAGDVTSVKAGTVYGPLVAGPDGVTKLVIFSTPDTAMRTPAQLRDEIAG